MNLQRERIVATPSEVDVAATPQVLDGSFVFGRIRTNRMSPAACELAGRVVDQLRADTAFHALVQPHREAIEALNPQIVQVTQERDGQIVNLEGEVDNLRVLINASERKAQTIRAQFDQMRGFRRWVYDASLWLGLTWIAGRIEWPVHQARDIYEGHRARRREMESRVVQASIEAAKRIEVYAAPKRAAERVIEEASIAWVLRSREGVLAYALVKWSTNTPRRERLFRDFDRVNGQEGQRGYDSLVKAYRELVVASVPSESVVIQSPSKRESRTTVRKRWVHNGEVKVGMPTKEAKKYRYSIGRVERYPDKRIVNTFRARVVLVPDEEVQVVINKEAAKIVNNDDARQKGIDAMINSLRRDPTGSGTINLSDHSITLEINDKVPLRRLAPHKRQGLSFKDPSLQDVRVIYFIHNVNGQPVVVIQDILTHGDYMEKYSSRKR